MAAWLLVLLLLIGLIVWVFRIFSRKSFSKNHEMRQLDDIYEEVKGHISFDTFSEIWLKVGEAFSIDPRLIKPSDTLKALCNIDSWDLGRGEDVLSEWIEQKHLGRPPALTTVLDLAKWIESERMSRS